MTTPPPMTPPPIKVLRLPEGDPAIPLPSHATDGAAGADLRANLVDVDRRHGVHLARGARALIPTGLVLAIPEGWEGQVRPRSGLSLRHGVTVANAPGTIDSDYRGPVFVILVNLGEETFHVTHGMRIAQLLLAPAPRISFEMVDDLPGTVRGAGGFGSTGTE